MAKKKVVLVPKKKSTQVKTAVRPRTPLRQYSILPLFSFTPACTRGCIYCPYAYRNSNTWAKPPLMDWCIYPWKHSILDFPDMSVSYIRDCLKRSFDIVLFATPCHDLFQILRYIDMREREAKKRIHVFCKINVLDPQISRWIEPRFPIPQVRIRVVEQLLNNGWDVYVISLPNFATIEEMRRLRQFFGKRYVITPRPKSLDELKRYKASPLYKPLMSRAKDEKGLKGLKRGPYIKVSTFEELESQRFVEEVIKIVQSNL